MSSPSANDNEPSRYLSMYSETQVRILQGCELSTALLSTVVGSIGIFLWCCMAPQRRIIFRLQLLVFLMCFDFIKAVFIMIISARRLDTLPQLFDDATFDTRFCNAFGYLVSVATFMSDFTMLYITLHNGIVIFFPKRTRPYRKEVSSFYHFFQSMWRLVTFRRAPWRLFDSYGPNPSVVTQTEGGLYPYRHLLFLSAIIGLSMPGIVFIGPNSDYTNNNICSTQSLPVWKRLINDWILKYINILTIVTIYGAIIIYLRFHFRRIEKSKRRVYEEARTKSNGMPNTSTLDFTKNLQRELLMIAEDTNEKRRQTAWRETNAFVVYPLGYVLVWLTPMIIQIWNYRTGMEAHKPFSVILIAAITMPLSCCVDTIIFLVREKPWTVTAEKMRRNSHPLNYASHEAPTYPSVRDGKVTQLYEPSRVYIPDTSTHGDAGLEMGKHSRDSSNSRTLVNGSRNDSEGSAFHYNGASGRPLSVLNDVEPEQSDAFAERSDDGDDVFDLNDFLRTTP